MQHTNERVAVVGGGIMGLTLAYYLTKAGVAVDIYEAGPELGGLAGPYALADGTQVDRFYHAVLSSDAKLMQLAAEVGVTDQLRFKQTRTGVYYKGRIHSMNTLMEFMRFPPLGWIDRFRLGITILAAQLISDWKSLEGTSVERWLIKLSGRNVYENIWRPMLKAKFDGSFDNVPATWIWSRLVRLKSTRKGVNQKEMAGHFIGGYITLLNAMAKRIRAAGGRILTGTRIDKVLIHGGRADGLVVGGQPVHYARVVVTAQTPVFRKLIPDAPADYHAFLDKTDYLGVISPLMALSKPLTGYWVTNITDDRFPFTGLIETTAFIDPKYVGGYHLVYLPKYTMPGSALQRMSDDELKHMWLDNLKTMLPDFDPSTVKHFAVLRERLVEPMHGLNSFGDIPAVETPVSQLFLATTAQIYPALTNGESVTRHAEQTAQMIIRSMLPVTASARAAVAGLASS
jgi:protoporphyrinogen oxidase